MTVHTRIPALFGAAAMTLTPWLILIHPGRRGDAALIAHEERHAQQMRDYGRLPWVWNYLRDPAFRQEQEVEAYRVQIAHGASLDGCARNLATLYRLGIDIQTARRLLA